MPSRRATRSAEKVDLPSLRVTSPSEGDSGSPYKDDGADADWVEMEEGVSSVLNSPPTEFQSPVMDPPLETPTRPPLRAAASRRTVNTLQKYMSRRPTPSNQGSRTRYEDVDDERRRSKIAYKAWKRCNKVLKKHDVSMVDGWKEDIDTLLVFAGLFSAVLTAFIVESYTFLQPDPAGTSTNILRAILAELRNSSSSVENEFPSIDSNPLAFAIRVNVFWFSSLVFSLASASIGILVKQWLRDYASHAGTASRDRARVRQFRHNGLINWHIPEIIAFLPILLQYALAFFFIGLLDLLWSLNFIVAGIVTSFVSASLAFLVVTTVLPALRADSPHRSPQALAIYLAYRGFIRLTVWVGLIVIKAFGVSMDAWHMENVFSHRWRSIRRWLVKLLHERKHRTWREREKFIVRMQAPALDGQILMNTDVLYLDDGILDEVIRPCLDEIEVPVAARCVLDILANRAHGMVGDLPSWRPSDVPERDVCVLINLTVDVLSRMSPADDQSCVERLLRILGKLCHATPFKVDHPVTNELYERICGTLAELLSFPGATSSVAYQLLYTLFPQASVRMNPTVIENIISFARSTRNTDNGDIDTYFSACVIALKFGADLHTDELHEYQDLLQDVLQELEQYVNLKNAMPSPSLRNALKTFADRGSSLVRPELISALDQLIGLAGEHHPQATSNRVMRNLRRLYSEGTPVRQSALLPVEDLGQLGLALPQHPGNSREEISLEHRGGSSGELYAT